MPTERRPARPAHLAAALATVLMALACALTVAGCAATASVPSGSGATATPASPAGAPQPTPLPAGSFTTYTNSAYGYSVSYPGNWSVEGADATAQSFTVFNYDPQTYQRPTSAPPLLKIELDAVANATNLAPLDLFKQSATGPGAPPASIQSAQATALAGHPAERIVWTSAASQYPTLTYVIARGANALFISQSNAANGQPSPIFTRMLASLTIGA